MKPKKSIDLLMILYTVLLLIQQEKRVLMSQNCVPRESRNDDII